jgi:hypothetical protein
LFGEDGSSEGDFPDISTPEGRHQNLSGKRIFAVPDTGGYVRGTRAFYELVDNGKLNGRALFNPVGYSKVWNIRFWVASVDHLQIENAGDGWARRAYPIPVLARSVRPDPDLKLLLEAVKADVISWALAMPRDNAIAFYYLSQKTNELLIYALMRLSTATAPRASSITACVRLLNRDSCPITCCTRCIPPTAKSMATRPWG